MAMLCGINLRISYVVTFEVGSKISEGHTLSLGRAFQGLRSPLA